MRSRAGVARPEGKSLRPDTLPEAGHAGAHIEAPRRPTVDASGLVGHKWSRPHKRHFAEEDIDELRYFVEAGAAQELAVTRYTR